jgi:hypothetical protein
MIGDNHELGTVMIVFDVMESACLALFACKGNLFLIFTLAFSLMLCVAALHQPNPSAYTALCLQAVAGADG